MALHWSSLIAEPNFHVVDAQYPGIPVGVARGCLARKHHNISVRSWVDCIIFAPQVVGRIVHLHSLNGIDCVIGNNDRISFLICECMVATANI